MTSAHLSELGAFLKAGELTLDWESLACGTDPDQQLVIWTAQPGTPSHDGLRILASWAAATPNRESAHVHHNP